MMPKRFKSGHPIQGTLCLALDKPLKSGKELAMGGPPSAHHHLGIGNVLQTSTGLKAQAVSGFVHCHPRPDPHYIELSELGVCGECAGFGNTHAPDGKFNPHKHSIMSQALNY